MPIYIQYKANYSMIHLQPTPRNFTGVHLTISSDTATFEQSYDENGRLITTVGDVWKLPHVTFQWRGANNQQRNFHVFINFIKGKPVKVNSSKQPFRSPSTHQKEMLDIAETMLRMDKINEILFSPEQYVKTTAEPGWTELK